MKVIFLDIDGVLNSVRWQTHQRAIDTGPVTTFFERSHENLDLAAVARLNQIIEATGASVVISSTWRILNTHTQLCEIFARNGFKGQILDETPKLGSNDILTNFAHIPEAIEFVEAHGVPRGCEIQSWLDRYREVIESFCIIDDDSDMIHLSDKLVHTSWLDGLLDHHINEAINLLGRHA